MLEKWIDSDVKVETAPIQVSKDVTLYTKILRGPRNTGRTALYIHGGGGGGNHTIVERPSRHMIKDGFFDVVILPDKRGDGGSTLLTRPLTIREHAQDMKLLLDQLEIKGPVTVLGISYGGPIALTLGHMDARVDRVFLVASSPTLGTTSGSAAFLLKTGLLKPLLRTMLKRNIGKLPPAYTDFDCVHEARKPGDMVRLYTDGLKRTPLNNLDSLLYSVEATIDRANASIPEDVFLSIPVRQVIGEKDEIWGTQIPPEFMRRFPNFKKYVVPGAKIHKDTLLKAGAFYEVLAQALREEFKR